MRAPKPFTGRAYSPEQKDLFIVAALLFTSIFIGLTVMTGFFLVDWTSILGIVYFIGFEMLFVGIAYDLTEAILALLLTPENLPKQSPLEEFPPVALLITVCNDVVPEAMERLQYQTYPNYDVFVLDDSSDQCQCAIVDQSGYTVLRRGGRRAYKAGNLNNWLDRYGLQHKYFVILDSDSIIPDDFIMRLVEYAEHPQNERIAVFQSKILPWNTSTSFSRTIGGIAPLRLHILERVANRTGMMLSWGHNNLNRTDCVLKVGGFHENLTAEDTTLSLMLSAKGHLVKLVDVLSYDTEPQDVFYYARRTVRWATQTVELFRLPWQSAAFRLKLLLCYHLYSYLIYNIYLGLFLLTAWTFRADSWSLRSFMTFVVNNQLYLTPWFVVLLIMTGLWSLQVVLRLVLAKKSAVSLRSYLLHGLLSNALMYFVVLPVGVAMVRTALGDQVYFTPTNTGTSSTPTLRAIVSRMWPSMVYGGLVLAGIAVQNRYLIFSLNCLWLVLWLAAPLVLWLFHIGKYASKTSLEGRRNEL